MQRSLAFLVLFAMTAGICPAYSAPTAGAQSAPGWHIRQNFDYHGPVEIKACALGCKFHSKDIFMFFKPKQDVVMLNDANKTMTKIDKNVWLNSQTVDQRTASCPERFLKQFKVPVSGTQTIAGLKCKQHWAVAYKHDKSFWYWWEFWTTDSIKLPREMTDDYLAIMHLPSGGGFPLKATKHWGKLNDPKHKQQVVLSTSKVDALTVQGKELIPPTGYRQVNDEMDIILGDGQGSKEQDNDEISKLLKAPKSKAGGIRK